jgi:hypothetical protein
MRMISAHTVEGEPMSDFEKLINASDLIEWIMETFPDWCVGAVRSIVDHVEALPSAPPERKSGKWIYHESVDVFECSVCGQQMVRNIFGYCPWCGARMEGEEDE